MTLSKRVLRQKPADVDDPKRVRVILRVRPMKSSENHRCVELGSNNTIILHEVTENSFGRLSRNRHEFRLDGCFGEASTQDEIFTKEVMPSLEKAFKRHNTTIFTYGITGSGKTFTMVGNEQQPGIIPRAVQYLFKKKTDIESCSKMEVRISFTMQFYEIIKDRIYDLIEYNGKELPLREAGDKEVIVCHLSENGIVDFNNFETLFLSGCSNRTTKSTNLNETSSRSHAVVVIRVYSFSKSSNTETLLSKINLIDLAGSEDNRQTGNTGDLLNESNAINLSLFTLGNCISALNAKKKRIPFRESKLTRVLSDSLGGTATSLLICTIPPSSNDFASTLSTLSFAVKSRNISNSVSTTDISVKDVLIPDLDCSAEEQSVSECSDPKPNATECSGAPQDDATKVASKNASLLPYSDKENFSMLDNCRKRDYATFLSQEQPQDNAEVSSWDVELYTTTKKLALANDFIKKGKECEGKNLEYDALVLFREAQQLMPAHEGIRAKFDTLDKRFRRRLMNRNDTNVDTLFSPVKLRDEPIPPKQSSFEDKFLAVLNNGNIKDLCSYKLIGKSIAANIIESRLEKTFTRVRISSPLNPFSLLLQISDLNGVGKINPKWIENFLMNNRQ